MSFQIMTHGKQIRAIDRVLEPVCIQQETHKANEARKARLKGERSAFTDDALRRLPSGKRDQALAAESQMADFIKNNFGYATVGSSPTMHLVGDDMGANEMLKAIKSEPIKVNRVKAPVQDNPIAKKISEKLAERVGR